jgi:hypothetical protein
MADLIKGLLAAADVRQVELGGKTFTSFTPHLEGATDKYQVRDAFSCDVVQYLTFCRSNPGKNSIRDYVNSTMAQLLYNNRHITSFEELYSLFNDWVLNWRGNEELCTREDVREIAREFMKVLETCPTMEDVKEHIIQFRVKVHWYPLNVELIGNQVERRLKKAEIRSESLTATIREDLICESETYRTRWWDISPTAKYLSEATDNAVSTVYKYGEGCYVGKKENTVALIKKLSGRHSTASVPEFVKAVKELEGIDLAETTVRRYLES